mmetsp:Transcript_58330/g.96631  ORF Transcript_58330/g.96631 Transcript_58330/m.96631 type:complete len:218 (-) Transcript_58330:416-1069(-)
MPRGQGVQCERCPELGSAGAFGLVWLHWWRWALILTVHRYRWWGLVQGPVQERAWPRHALQTPMPQQCRRYRQSFCGPSPLFPQNNWPGWPQRSSCALPPGAFSPPLPSLHPARPTFGSLPPAPAPSPLPRLAIWPTHAPAAFLPSQAPFDKDQTVGWTLQSPPRSFAAPPPRALSLGLLQGPLEERKPLRVEGESQASSCEGPPTPALRCVCPSSS